MSFVILKSFKLTVLAQPTHSLKASKQKLIKPPKMKSSGATI